MGERNLRNRQFEPLRSRIGAALAKSVTKGGEPVAADRVAILAIPAESANGATDAPLLREELERAQRVASGQIGTQDLDWLSKGFSAFLANGGALPLERCLRLPGRDGALRRECRDYWLRSAWKMTGRSEEHTSELQSHSDLVCRLLLEKKKQTRRADDKSATHPIHVHG